MQKDFSASLPSVRTVPFSLEAEMSTLGAIFIDPEQFQKVAGMIRSDDFYLEQHTAIYDAMAMLFSKNQNIDAVTVLNMLTENGTFDSAGGKNYIMSLADSVPSVSNILDYARIIKEKSLLRKLIHAAEEISELAYNAEGSANDIIDISEQKIFNIAEGNVNDGFIKISEAIALHLQSLNVLCNSNGAGTGTQTYFSDIDNMIVGMNDSDLILVGARPGMGKTSFCLNIASNVAEKTKKEVAVFSLEMSSEQLVSRMISSEAMVDNTKIRRGELNEEDWVRIARAANVLSETNILIDDTTDITVTGMKAKLRRLKNLGLVIIDYLQLMHADKKTDNRVQEVADISRNLKLLAKDIGVPVITCAQLSRSPEGRNDKRPVLSDLRDSGAIEQDADVVMFLYKDEYYNKKTDEQNVAECIIAKNRHGSTGNIKLGWYGQFTKFTSLDKTHTT